jgi:hypothetical protein
MREPPYVTSLRLPVTPVLVNDQGLVGRLLALAGVTDAVVVAEEQAVYIKIDTKIVDRAQLERLVSQTPVAA